MYEIAAIPETIQDELDRRLFHLKTLYDVSHDLLGIVEVEAILKNFLMMTTGNFGVIEGLILIQDVPSEEITHFISLGFGSNDRTSLEEHGNWLLLDLKKDGAAVNDQVIEDTGILPPAIVCALTFSVDEACLGLLGLGPKIVDEPYSDDDKDILETLVNNLVIFLKNARATEALKEAYEEVSSLNKAKDKVINHLSHELKTPIASIIGCLTQLKRKLSPVPRENWQRTMARAQRNAERLLDIQYEVGDIMEDKEYRSHNILSLLLDQCADELEILAAEHIGDGPVVARIRERIEEIFGKKESVSESIFLDKFVKEKIDEITPFFSHRQVDVITDTELTQPVWLPLDALEKVVKGLIRNGIENTPDEGKIEVTVKNKGQGVALVIHDTGVGIVPEHQKRIFEGFFPTQETTAYASRKPFVFNAGGKGADLLRMKIFSERFNFKLNMTSSRCRHLLLASDICPGRISRCEHCAKVEDCYNSGGTTFTAVFPFEPQPAPHKR
jgi:signal transduction histidine kinase